jgi:transposase
MPVLSTDLRTRAIEAYERTGNKSQVCRTFNIARTTLDTQAQPSSCTRAEHVPHFPRSWIQLKSETGSLDQQAWGGGRKHTILDWDAFKAFVEQTSFDTITQLVPLYEQHFGKPIDYECLRTSVHRLGLTHKKRVSHTKKPTTLVNVSSDG